MIELTLVRCPCGWEGPMSLLMWNEKDGYCPDCEEFVVTLSGVAS